MLELDHGHEQQRTEERDVVCRTLVMQCVAVCCNVLQCDAVCCGVSSPTKKQSNAVKHVAVRCSVLQCVAVCCSVLQCHTGRPTMQKKGAASVLIVVWLCFDCVLPTARFHSRILPRHKHRQRHRLRQRAWIYLYLHICTFIYSRMPWQCGSALHRYICIYLFAYASQCVAVCCSICLYIHVCFRFLSGKNRSIIDVFLSLSLHFSVIHFLIHALENICSAHHAHRCSHVCVLHTYQIRTCTRGYISIYKCTYLHV